MTRWLVSILCFCFIFSFSSVYAQTDLPLGNGHAGFKVDYISFTDSILDDADIDSGIYFGLEGYMNINPNLYIGGEIGYANPDGSVNVLGLSVDTELEYIPIEVNVKYVIKQGENLSVSLGGGLSYNSLDVKLSVLGVSVSDDEWLLGGQVFADLNYMVDNYFVGAHVKYKLTEDWDNEDYSNFRIGVHAGLTF